MTLATHVTAQGEARANRLLYEERLARAHDRIAAFLVLERLQPADVERARDQVRKWADEEICSRWYVDQWEATLSGTAREIAGKILDLETENAKALFHNTPFGFLVREFISA